MMSGYLGNLTATCDVLDDGWLRTGDFGFVRDGKVYISGRIKVIITWKGFRMKSAMVTNETRSSSKFVVGKLLQRNLSQFCCYTRL